LKNEGKLTCSDLRPSATSLSASAHAMNFSIVTKQNCEAKEYSTRWESC
jgi:hypothetical protein